MTTVQTNGDLDGGLSLVLQLLAVFRTVHSRHVSADMDPDELQFRNSEQGGTGLLFSHLAIQDSASLLFPWQESISQLPGLKAAWLHVRVIWDCSSTCVPQPLC